jgi:sterol desaturase/sphingolipid hydroxylase (fatty acid hydroxylase superfamily)
MIGIPIGLAYTNAAEWFIHRYILHGLGKRKESFWAFHWFDHHSNVRRNHHCDPHYRRSLWSWHAQSKEALALALSTAVHLPLFPIAPFFTATVCYSAVNYYQKHKRSHLDTKWARDNLPWHYDHHMGPNQDANWCITKPWFDIVMGTRVPYVDTDREKRDIAKRGRRKRTRIVATAVAA